MRLGVTITNLFSTCCGSWKVMEPRMAAGRSTSKGLPITPVCFWPEDLGAQVTHCGLNHLSTSSFVVSDPLPRMCLGPLRPSIPSAQLDSAPVRSSSEAFPSIPRSCGSSFDCSPSSSNVSSALSLLGVLIISCLCSLLRRQPG